MIPILKQIEPNCVICFKEYFLITDFGFFGAVDGEPTLISHRLFLSTFIKVNLSGTMLKPMSIGELFKLMNPIDQHTFFEGKSLKATGLQQIRIPELGFNRITGKIIGPKIVTQAVLEII